VRQVLPRPMLRLGTEKSSTCCWQEKSASAVTALLLWGSYQGDEKHLEREGAKVVREEQEPGQSGRKAEGWLRKHGAYQVSLGRGGSMEERP